MDNEHVRLGRFLAGKDDEPKVAAMPPDGGRAELVPGAGSGCGGLLRLRSYGDECDWGDGEGAATPDTLGDEPRAPLPPPPPPTTTGMIWLAVGHGRSHGSAKNTKHN